MSITDKQKAQLMSRSPKSRNSAAPDPTWKAQQAFIRATRRGSKKHTTPEQKLKLLDAALAAIPSKPKPAPIVGEIPRPTFSGINLSPQVKKP